MKIKFDIILFTIVLFYSLIIVLFNYLYKVKTIYFPLKNTKAVDNIHNQIEGNSNYDTTLNTKHYWNEEIGSELQVNIMQINDEILTHLHKDMIYIPSMTELYYSSKGNQNSDQQYVSTHTDGPFFACQVYRALVIINGNKNIDTFFPNEIPSKYNLKKYDVILFDYNNTSHYIRVNNQELDTSQRIIIKLHYTWKNASLCESNHCKFGRETRDLFELNKKDLYLSGVVARSGLYFFTFRHYIVVLMAIVLYYYYKTKNVILRCILWTFVVIEVITILYSLHFNFVDRKQCIKQQP